MNFTKYEKYKDSGLKWLGDIPEDWKIERNKESINNILGLRDERRSAFNRFTYYRRNSEK